MAKTLTSYNTTETTKTITQPYFLVQLGFTTPLNYSTLHGITLDGVVYSADRKVDVGNLRTNKTGDVTADIELSNVDNAISVHVLAESPAGLPCKIYKVYGTTPTVSDMILLLDGKMDAAVIGTKSVSINVYSNSALKQSPGFVISKPVFNHLPPSGTVIKTGNTTITLNSSGH